MSADARFKKIGVMWQDNVDWEIANSLGNEVGDNEKNKEGAGKGGEQGDQDTTDDKKLKKKKKKSSLQKEALEYTEKLSKRGVIYISRVPPFMKPNKARILFEEYGEVTRLYLAEEDGSYSKKRKASGGNGSKQFKEGWVEYSDKKIAKRVAESLNGTTIGSKKGDFYRDDLWNLKYLKKFQWDYLTEKFAYERRVREQKLKASMLQAKRGNAEFVELIEKNKASAHAQARKKRKSEENGNDSTAPAAEGNEKSKRQFKQVQRLAANHGEQDALIGKSLLSKVFKGKK